MSSPNVEATRRRGALRGEEAVAAWRIKTGTWAARAYAVVRAVPALAALFWQGPATLLVIVYSLLTAGIVLFASFRIASGSRRAAIAVLILFALDKLFAVVAYGWPGVIQGLLITAIIAFGLIQRVWGTNRLRTIAAERKRDDATVVQAL
jgi:hypothetical protein